MGAYTLAGMLKVLQAHRCLLHEGMFFYVTTVGRMTQQQV